MTQFFLGTLMLVATCEPTTLPETKTVVIDGEEVRACLICEYDIDTSRYEWTYRTYSCPGVDFPDFN